MIFENCELLSYNNEDDIKKSLTKSNNIYEIAACNILQIIKKMLIIIDKAV
jgi:hypothetical protein